MFSRRRIAQHVLAHGHFGI
jgi:hypothetical protein